MKRKTVKSMPSFDTEGYQSGVNELNGEPLPDWKTLATQPRLSLEQARASSRGGSRPGAGRKPVGKLRKQVKLSAGAVSRLNRYAKRRHLDFSSALEVVVMGAKLG